MKELLNTSFPNCSYLKTLKKHLDGIRFTTDADVKQAVTSYITSIVTTWMSGVYYLLPCAMYISK